MQYCENHIVGPPSAMVADFKQRQRDDPAFKEAWVQYCENHIVGGMRGTRDPSRHDVATLQAFLDSYDPSKVDIEHAQLCNTVKTAQKDPQLKESWCRWADDESLGQLKGTRDPSRHSK